MNILVIGSGGREHSLIWKLAQSSKIKDGNGKIFAIPGNAGTAPLATNILLPKTPSKTEEVESIVEWLGRNPMDLVIVGPDDYLAEGLVDRLQKLDVRVFGPTRSAAEIEWSKAYAKQFMKEEGIPTAEYEIFTNIEQAKKYLRERSQFPVVIKASGLALGKGVIIDKNLIEADKALEDIMLDKIFGSAGNEVIIEEYLEGQEISIHAFCDGEYSAMFPPAQDHKRAFDGDLGPNTGGMGTIAPVPWVSKELMSEIHNTIVTPTLRALARRGRPFRGVLFPGIIITKKGPQVIEFNARFGDPETQSYMQILESDLIDILIACTSGSIDLKAPKEKLKDLKIKWSSQSACCIVCASAGYPGKYNKGKVIIGLDKIVIDGVKVFHAGTELVKIAGNDQAVTNGGRVLGVSATGIDLMTALENAYKAVSTLSFEGMQYRKDIGRKSL